MDQFELGGVGVLILIHHHVFVFGTACCKDVRMLAEKLEGQQDQIVEIHRVAGAEGALITGATCRARAAVLGSAKTAARSPPLR